MARQGFTLIEVVIVLAVVAILAAVLVPMIGSNIQQARVAKTASDVAAISQAMVRFHQDLGFWPLRTAAAPPTGVAELFGPGTVPPAGMGTTWQGRVPAQAFAYHLIDNSNNYTRGPSPQGLPAWNGPYLSEIRSDPWARAYLANVAYLPGGSAANPATRVYVLSAGPDNETQTDFAGTTALGGDDVGSRLQ
jgi:general secretion pathway protein G